MLRDQEDLKPIDFPYINLGLNDVFYNPQTKVIYTPNTNQTAIMGENTANVLPDEENGDIIEERANDKHNPKNGQFASKNENQSISDTGIDKSENSDIIEKNKPIKEYDTSTLNSSNIEISNHAVEQAAKRGITKDEIIDAIDNPLDEKPVKWDENGRPSFQRIGESATTAINPENRKLASTWKTHKKLRNKLKGRK